MNHYLVGSGAGFSGDRTDAAAPVVETIIRRNTPGALIFETLGERTLALAQLARRENPERGYEPLLEGYLRPIVRRRVDAGIPIVGNAGPNAETRARLALDVLRPRSDGALKFRGDVIGSVSIFSDEARAKVDILELS